MLHLARVAYNYKINPFILSSEQFLLLHYCLQEVQIEEELFQRQIASQMTPERVKYLTYILTRDIEKAEMAEAKEWLRIDKQALLPLLRKVK